MKRHSKLFLPDRSLLSKTSDIDYFDWSYRFPIKYIIRYRLEKIAQLLGSKKYDMLLEAGVGSGLFLPELSKHCEHLYAIDIHDHFDQIESLNKVYHFHDFHPSTQSVDNTNFEDETFDAVVAASVLEFVPDVQKAVTEIKRIMKKNGVFITICPMESRLLDFFLSFYSRKSPKDEFGNARQNVSKVLESNFSVVKKGYMLPIIGKFFPIYTHYLLMKK